jgi:hypothetical protein
VVVVEGRVVVVVMEVEADVDVDGGSVGHGDDEVLATMTGLYLGSLR